MAATVRISSWGAVASGASGDGETNEVRRLAGHISCSSCRAEMTALGRPCGFSNAAHTDDPNTDTDAAHSRILHRLPVSASGPVGAGGRLDGPPRGDKTLAIPYHLGLTSRVVPVPNGIVRPPVRAGGGPRIGVERPPGAGRTVVQFGPV